VPTNKQRIKPLHKGHLEQILRINVRFIYLFLRAVTCKSAQIDLLLCNQGSRGNMMRHKQMLKPFDAQWSSLVHSG